MIKYLGHSSIFLQHKNTSVVVDPWFSETGAFLGSWHQFPEPVDVNLEDVRNVDYVILTHEHLDHFDIDFLRTINSKVKIIIPTFKDKYLYNSLSELSNKVIEVEYKTKYKLDEDFYCLPLTQTVPIQMDCTWVFEKGEEVIVNINDMQPTGKDLEWIKNNYPSIDYLFHQYSGANWYPHVYSYEKDEKIKLSNKKVKNKFHNCVTNFNTLGAKWLIPSAGPPCFLDKDLYYLNFDESSTFPTLDIFYEYCKQMKIHNVILALPNDIIVDDTNNRLVLESEPYSNKKEYLKKYQQKRKNVIQDYKEKISNCNTDNLLEKFKNHIEPLIESSNFFRKEIGGKVLFQVGDEKFLVDFRRRKNSVSVWDGKDEYMYKYIVAKEWFAMIMAGKLRWEELFLSVRFSAYREPDVHNQALQTFLYYIDDDMYKVYEQYYVNQKLEETFELKYEGNIYDIQRYCPHAMADLSKGKIIDGEIICPNHGWAFNIKSGHCQKHDSKIRCNKKVNYEYN